MNLIWTFQLKIRLQIFLLFVLYRELRAWTSHTVSVVTVNRRYCTEGTRATHTTTGRLLGRATLLSPPWAELNQRTRLAGPLLACELTLLSPFRTRYSAAAAAGGGCRGWRYGERWALAPFFGGSAPQRRRRGDVMAVCSWPSVAAAEMRHPA